MAQELKLFNGRGYSLRKHADPLWKKWEAECARRECHLYVNGYVAAYSMADCRRVIAEYCGRDPGVTEIRDYWNKGAWGIYMQHVTPERGLWLHPDHRSHDEKPIRVL
jgi:hypothetical protein